MERRLRVWTAVGAASLLLLGGCGRDVRQRVQLAWIKVDRAEADADRAIAAGDRRLYGVYGYAREVPGAPEGAAYEPNGCGLKMIKGTNDYSYSDDTYHRPRAYALRYNQRVLSRTHCLAMGQPGSKPQQEAFDFSRSYGLWVRLQERECRYWVTHISLDADQLRDQLRGYEVANGVEILTEDGTPARCVAEARRVATEAGFHHLRVRKNAPGDRPAGPL